MYIVKHAMVNCRIVTVNAEANEIGNVLIWINVLITKIILKVKSTLKTRIRSVLILLKIARHKELS